MTFDEWFAKEYSGDVGEDGLRVLLREAWDAALAARPEEGRGMLLVPVEPAPTYIESSGRWKWPLPERARFPGCSTDVVTAFREWWEYAPSEAKPHPMAEAVQLRDSRWYWVLPSPPPQKG